MNSIDKMAHDMERQLQDLPAMPLPEQTTGRIIIAGSGDSYVAALAGHYLSKGRVVCYQPEDIILDPCIVGRSNVYFVSVSGKTRANVLAAKAARNFGAKTIAITAGTSSPLSAICEDIFRVEFISAGKTSGTISFTASLLACGRLAAGVSCPKALKSIYNTAAKNARNLAKDISAKSIVMLGESFLWPSAIYGALKFNEVLGSRASTYRLGDFCHAPLFGHKEGQVIIVGTKKDSRIAHRLATSGINARYVDCGKYDRFGSILYATFFMQHLALIIARKKRMKECYFLQDEKLLKTSSDIIY